MPARGLRFGQNPPNPQNNNCVIIAAQTGPKTLQEIGEVFNITRMRVCQIEKSIISKTTTF